MPWFVNTHCAHHAQVSLILTDFRGHEWRIHCAASVLHLLSQGHEIGEVTATVCDFCGETPILWELVRDWRSVEPDFADNSARTKRRTP
jgi:hypothetical protein